MNWTCKCDETTHCDACWLADEISASRAQCEDGDDADAITRLRGVEAWIDAQRGDE